MTTDDTFDRRLGEALHTYAVDAPIEPDPMAFAAEIAAAHPRSRFGAIAGSLWRTEPRLLWVAIALLLLAAAAGAALVGMRSLQPDPPRFVGQPAPAELFGRWRSDANPGRYLDLNSTWMLHEAGGRPLDWFGSVVDFVPASAGAIEGTVLIQSARPCGNASYRLVIDDRPPPGPTAAPDLSPVESQPPRLNHVAAIRFVDPVDRCPARQSILQSGPWRALTLALAAGGSFDSLDFSEPFRMTLPLDLALGLFNAEAGTMYQDQRNQLRISHAWWGAAFVDDIPVNRVPCRPDLGTLPDIPATVEEVGAWLMSATEVRFNGPAELVVDGRRALRWEMDGDCRTETAAVSDLARGVEYYAIPTGDDVILFVVRADTANESRVAERIVLALQFD